MNVAVVTDSAAALPRELAERHGIGVVPLWLHIGDDSYRDGERPLEELVARFDEPISTSGPSPGEFVEAVEAATRRAPNVLVLTVAAAISSTHEAALLAATQLGPHVRVLDTRTAAGAQGLVALATADAAAGGADLDGVESAARSAMERVRLVATVPNLDRLARSGRVPEAARWIGSRVGMQPMFEFRGGRARPARPAFSRRAALERIVRRCATDDVGGGPVHVAVLHALDASAAGFLDDRVQELHPATCFTGSFSPVMVAHTGGGLAGLAWWREP